MIHMMLSYPDRIEQKEIDEEDFPQLEAYEAMRNKMVQKGCTTIVVMLDDGFQVLYSVNKDAD